MHATPALKMQTLGFRYWPIATAMPYVCQSVMQTIRCNVMLIMQSAVFLIHPIERRGSILCNERSKLNAQSQSLLIDLGRLIGIVTHQRCELLRDWKSPLAFRADLVDVG